MYSVRTACVPTMEPVHTGKGGLHKWVRRRVTHRGHLTAFDTTVGHVHMRFIALDRNLRVRKCKFLYWLADARVPKA